MRLCYDACNPAHIPVWSELVGGYVDADCLWPLGQIARAQVRITSTGMDAGNTIDIEYGNANALWVPGWVERARARGVAYPIVYAIDKNAAGASPGFTWQECQQAVDNAGIAPPLWWVSFYQARELIPGSVMTQYALNVAPGYDVSYALDYIPGIDQDPQGETMPAEVAQYFSPKVQPGDCPLDLALQVNTRLDLVFVDVRDYTGSGKLDAHVVLVGDDGLPIADQHLAPVSTGTAEWRVPDGQVGDLVLQSATEPCSVSVKVATRP